MATTMTDRLSGAATSAETALTAYGFTGLAVLASADEAELASAATVDLLGSSSLLNRITGTASITSLGTAANRIKFARFTGAALLTHNAVSLVLPTGSNITTAAGDSMIVVSDEAGNARVIAYQRADGAALSGMAPATYDPASLAEQVVGVSATQTLTNKTLTSAVLNTGISGTAILDEDTMSSDSSTKLATQQSIKAYVDAGDTGKHSIYIPAGAMVTAATSGAGGGSVEETTNKHNYTTLDFDASADEFAHFEVPMPKDWNEGTLSFQVVWSTTATDGDGVAWGLQAVAVADGEDGDVAYGTAVVVTDSAQSNAGDVLVSAESAALTVAGAPTAGELTLFRVFRDVSDGGDDMAEDALLRGVRIFFTTDASDES